MLNILQGHIHSHLAQGFPRFNNYPHHHTTKPPSVMAYYSDDDEDYDYSSLQTITLFDNEPDTTGAQLKFDYEGTDFHYDEDGDSQPDGIVDEDVGDGALSLKCDITKVVNGTLNKDGPPATLIVFQFAFLPHGNNHRFKKVQIIITFSSGKVHSISPENEWTTLPSEKVQERTHTVSPSLEAAFGPAKATTAYTWQQKETQTLRGYAKVTGAIRSTGRRTLGISRKKEKNTVMWGLYEDPQARPRTGIPSLLQSAVLVEREATVNKPFGERFSASIRIHGNVDSAAEARDKAAEAGKWMTGKTRKGRDIWFHPDPRRNKGTAVHPDSLEDEDLDSYRHLIAIRSWEPAATPSESKADGAAVNPTGSSDSRLGVTGPSGASLPASGFTSTTTTHGPPTPAPTPALTVGPTPIPIIRTEPPAANKLPAHSGITNNTNTTEPTSISREAVAGSKALAATLDEGQPLPPPPSQPQLPVSKTGKGKEKWNSEDETPFIRSKSAPTKARKGTRVLAQGIFADLTDDEEDGDEDEFDAEEGGSDLSSYYKEQLRLVRAEKKWSARVVKLLAEERRLLGKIAGTSGNA